MAKEWFICLFWLTLLTLARYIAEAVFSVELSVLLCSLDVGNFVQPKSIDAILDKILLLLVELKVALFFGLNWIEWLELFSYVYVQLS